MEFMAGGDLANIIAILREHEKQMSEPHIAFVCAEVCVCVIDIDSTTDDPLTH
jgi:hypothetical protein